MADGSVNTPSLLDDGYNLRSRWVGKRKRGSSQDSTSQRTTPEPPKLITMWENAINHHKSLSSEEQRAYTLKWWKGFGDKALEHYNSTQHTDYKYVVSKGLRITVTPYMHVHCNFLARDDSSGDEKLFYAQLVVPPTDLNLPTRVLGCCTLKKTEAAADSTAPSCHICGDGLKHPGPYYGYCSESGDLCQFNVRDALQYIE